jgi:PAT family beta-lactamase induction signal transducer AmpG
MSATPSVPGSRNPWAWVPTLYFYQGIPYSIVMITSGVIYKTMGESIAVFAFWTSILYLPWAVKPLWSPYVEVTSTKRNWVVITQLLLGIAFLAAGFAMKLPMYFPVTLALFGIVALSSASHDIAADGFYMHALDQHRQSFFVGIRSTFYRFAMLTSLGLLPLVAGIIQEKTGLEPLQFTVRSVPATDYVPVDQASIQVKQKKGKPEILLFPKQPLIPLYEKDRATQDSTVIYLALSAPPEAGRTIVVNLNRNSGSKDIDQVRGHSGRFEFTSSNWNQPFPVTLKVDHNLKNGVESGFKATAGDIALSWTLSLALLGIVLLVLGIYHRFLLPHPVEHRDEKSRAGFRIYVDVFVSFFTRKGIIPALLFFLLYRFAEAQLVKVATPFLVDSRSAGGIGMTSAQYGIAYGTVGMVCLTIGGILGGITAARYGLKRLIWLMAIAMNLPNAVYIFLAAAQPMPTSLWVYGSIAIEQFGYGYGFTAYMLYMLAFVGESRYKTAEYAIGSSLMALGMMLPGMISGYMKEMLGYPHFFTYVLICTIPGMIVIKFLKIDPGFGIKRT